MVLHMYTHTHTVCFWKSVQLALAACRFGMSETNIPLNYDTTPTQSTKSVQNTLLIVWKAGTLTRSPKCLPSYRKAGHSASGWLWEWYAPWSWFSFSLLACSLECIMTSLIFLQSIKCNNGIIMHFCMKYKWWKAELEPGNRSKVMITCTVGQSKSKLMRTCSRPPQL